MKFSLYILSILVVVITLSCKSDKASSPEIQPKVSTTSEKINWMSLEEAEKANAKEKKDLYIMVFAPWCPKCKNYEATTYRDPKVIKEINENFYPVKLNAQESRPITFKGKTSVNKNFDKNKAYTDQNSYHDILFQVPAKGIPALIFMDSNLEITGSETGFKEASELRSLLRLYGSF